MSARDVLKDFQRKRKLLNNLRETHASERLAAMWEFLDGIDETQRIIEAINKEHPDILVLIRKGEPAKAGLEGEIIVVGLFVMEACHESHEHLTSIVKRLGLVSAQGATRQSYVDDAMNGYVQHALDYVEEELERMVEAEKTAENDKKVNTSDEFQRIRLEPEQKELLSVIVEAVRNVPRKNRQKFMVTQTFDGTFMYHNGLAENTEVYLGDIEILASEGLLATTTSPKGTTLFDVTPLGIAYYDYMKRDIDKKSEPSARKPDESTDKKSKKGGTYGEGKYGEGTYGGSYNEKELQEDFASFLIKEKGWPEVYFDSENDDVAIDLSLRHPESRKLVAVFNFKEKTDRKIESKAKATFAQYADLEIGKFLVTPSSEESNYSFTIYQYSDRGLVRMQPDDFPEYSKLLESHNLHKTNAPNGLDFLNDMPELPPFFKDSSSKINALRTILLEGNKSIVIAGEPGIGKTTLAHVLMRDKEIRQNFKDGVIKISLTAIKDIIAAQCQVAHAFVNTFEQPKSVESGRMLLKEIFEGKKVLLVLDNCENNENVKAFSGLGSGVKLVVLTRTENPEEMAQLISGVVYRPVPFGGKSQNEPSTIGSGLHMNKRAGKTEICLNAHDYAEVLEEVVLGGQKDEEGFCFALFGHWGRGKTFLMKLVEDRLKKENYETIFFSAWKYPTKPEIWVHIYETFVKKAFDFHAKGTIATTVRAGFVKKVIWPMVIQILLLAYFAAPKFDILWSISGKVSLIAILFLIGFIFRAKYSLTYLFRKYFTLATHKEKLGLQKTVGDDLACLLQAWVARDKCPQLSKLQKRSLFLSLLVLLLCLSFRFITFLKGGVISWGSLTIAGLFLVSLAGLCRLYFYLMETGSWPEKVLLVIDDLDRCNVDEIVDIIGSIKLFAEEEEIRKRVQVVILIEEDVLRHALAEKYSGLINSDLSSKDDNYINRIINENMEKIFIGHLRLNELTTEEVEQVISKVTGKHVANETFQNKPDDSGEIKKTHGDNDNQTTKKPPKIVQESKEDVRKRVSTVFSVTEHNLLREHVIRLGGGEYGVKLGPRAIRCFTMKYQVGRLICDKLGLECPAKELVEAIVMCYRGDGDGEKENLMLDVARQVC